MQNRPLYHRGRLHQILDALQDPLLGHPRQHAIAVVAVRTVLAVFCADVVVDERFLAPPVAGLMINVMRCHQRTADGAGEQSLERIDALVFGPGVTATLALTLAALCSRIVRILPGFFLTQSLRRFPQGARH